MKNMSYLATYAVFASLSLIGAASAQTAQTVANYVKADFDTVNAYSDDLVAGRATDVEQAACQKSLSNLTDFVIAHASEDPFAPTAQNDAVLDDAIVKNLLKADTTPCPAIAAYRTYGKSVFTPLDPLMARTLDPFMQEEVAMHSFMVSVVAYGNLRAAGQASADKRQICMANFNTMKNFIVNAEHEQAAGNAPASDMALYNELMPLMPKFGANPCN